MNPIIDDMILLDPFKRSERGLRKPKQANDPKTIKARKERKRKKQHQRRKNKR